MCSLNNYKNWLLVRPALKITTLICIQCVLFACSGGNNDTTVTPTEDPTPLPTLEPTPINAPEDVFISGIATFDYVPHRDTNGALYYLGSEPRPIRGATAQLVDADGVILRESVTSETGAYQLGAPANTPVRVRILAELKNSIGAQYRFRVMDNTDDNSLYALQGSLLSSGTADSGRDLFAPSGWSEEVNEYDSPRAAAPFAILDTAYRTVALIKTVDANVVLSNLDIGWSINNRGIFGEVELGEIGTSAFFPTLNKIYLLGTADDDTDEYDPSVIVHELGHFFESEISRTENPGGDHSLEALLDMRVAFSEGWGNAFASMVLQQEFYEDSHGSNQDLAWRFSVEDNFYSSDGWYSENAVQQILYDIFDENNENADSLTLGFSPIYSALTRADYLNSSAFTSIYLFVDQLLETAPTATNGVIALLQNHQIYGTGPYGVGETTDGGISRVLPLYQQLTLGQNISFCTGNSLGEFNVIDNRRFFRIEVPQAGNRLINFNLLDRPSGSVAGLMVAYLNGNYIDAIEFSANGSFNRNIDLPTAGTYVFEYYENQNVDDESGTGGNVCTNLTVN